MTEPREPVWSGRQRAAGTHAATRAAAAEPDDYQVWEGRTRVYLQPIAAPSILGLFGFAGATMMVGAWQAGWYGDALTPLVIFPFCAMFGGLAQFLAGMWSYKARDGLATAMHGMWGSFWLAFGLLFLLISTGAFPAARVPAIGTANAGFGFWFLVLALITMIGAVAAIPETIGMVVVLTFLFSGSAFTAAAFFGGITWCATVGGWLFVCSAAAAVYTASALMLEGSFGRTVLPTGKLRGEANIPGRQMRRPLEYRYGQPGVKIGQ